MNSLTPAELSSLRAAAEAAKRQMEHGPKEWPGRPSAQRLALFLAATPDVVLRLVSIAERRQPPRGGRSARRFLAQDQQTLFDDLEIPDGREAAA